jgi:hypothetical protein
VGGGRVVARDFPAAAPHRRIIFEKKNLKERIKKKETRSVRRRTPFSS